MDAERDRMDSTGLDTDVSIPRQVAVSMPAEGTGSWKEPHGCDGVLPEVRSQPLNGWREVCRWEEDGASQCGEEGRWVTPDDGLGYIHAMPLDNDTVVFIDSRDWRTRYEQLLKIARRLEERVAREDMVDAFANMAAAFEELAGEHRELRDSIAAEFLAERRAFERQVAPEPSEDQVSVRPYVRAKPRRSKLVKTEGIPTGDTDGGANRPQAMRSEQPGPMLIGGDMVANSASNPGTYDCTDTSAHNGGVEGQDWHFTAHTDAGLTEAPSAEHGPEIFEERRE